MGEKRQQREKKKPLTKVIIRQLPPTMTEEDFLKQIDPLPEHDDYYFVSADWSLGLEATCRAYLNFTNPEDVFLFKERFDGYVFVDGKGTEYAAQVEYAPFQGFSKSRSKKKDIKVNTIETDVHYLEFVERFNNQESDLVKGDLKFDFNLNSKKDNSGQSTPLLDYIQDKKDARREERKRKNDERKERREKERQQKKIMVAKNIPPAIKEEGAVGSESQGLESKESGTSGNSKNSQEEKPKENKRDRYEEKRIQRKREKDAKRRERRDQKRAEERREGKESVDNNLTKKVEEMSLGETSSEKKSEEPRDSQREDSKTDQTEKRNDKKDERRERRERKEEKERRIRNKDRPDMQIYQPGKLRTNTNSGEENTPAPSTSNVKKRVSRYSEKRRAKENISGKDEKDPIPSQESL